MFSPPDDDHVLHAVVDVQVAVAQVAGVAGAEPAVGRDRRRRWPPACASSPPCSAAPHPDLADLAVGHVAAVSVDDPQLDAAHGRPAARKSPRAGRRGRGRRAAGAPRAPSVSVSPYACTKPQPNISIDRTSTSSLIGDAPYTIVRRLEKSVCSTPGVASRICSTAGTNSALVTPYFGMSRGSRRGRPRGAARCARRRMRPMIPQPRPRCGTAASPRGSRCRARAASARWPRSTSGTVAGASSSRPSAARSFPTCRAGPHVVGRHVEHGSSDGCASRHSAKPGRSVARLGGDHQHAPSRAPTRSPRCTARNSSPTTSTRACESLRMCSISGGASRQFTPRARRRASPRRAAARRTRARSCRGWRRGRRARYRRRAARAPPGSTARRAPRR